MASSPRPSKVPLLASLVVIVLLAGSFAYVYENSNSTIAGKDSSITSLNGQVSSYATVVSSLDANITHQINAENAALARLAAANATISSKTATIESLSSEVGSYSRQVNLEVEQTLENSEMLTLPYNSTTTIAHFTASSGGYIQVSGTSNTFIAIGVCYGVTSLSDCEKSTSYFLIVFGYGGGTFNVPLMPGPVWMFASNKDAGTATLTIVLWT